MQNISDQFKGRKVAGFISTPLAGLNRPRQLLQVPEVEAHADQRLRIVFMNPFSKEDFKSNQETEAFDLPPIHEEEVVHPAPDDDEKGSAEKSEPIQIEEDKERTEIVTKEAMLRVTGGQL